MIVRSFLMFVLAALTAGPALAGWPFGNGARIIEFRGEDVWDGVVIVTFAEGTTGAQMDAIHAQLGIEESHRVHRVSIVTVPAGATLASLLFAYLQFDAVETAEPDRVMYTTVNPNDPQFSNQWGPKKIRCPEAWDKYKGNGSYFTAVLDTGVRKSHADLNDHIVPGYDFWENDNDPQDSYGHGTHVAGIAAAETNNSTGVAGVGWDCKFMPLRVGPGPSLDTGAIVSAIYYAADNGAYSINMSFGCSGSSAMKTALDYAYGKGVVNVASAGNNGDTSTCYPAAYASVIAVAASNSSDGRASFSNYGDWVEVAAPGVGILSTWNDGGYAYLDGTSMASPHVAGMAAYLYGYGALPRNQANADKVRNAIQDSAVPNSYTHFGRVDVRAALDKISTFDHCTDPVTYGQGTPGTGGVEPLISFAQGPPFIGNQNFKITGSNMFGASSGVFLVGFAQAYINLGQGLIVNVAPPYIIVQISTSGPGLPGVGTVEVPVPIPNDVSLDGLAFDTQFLVHDGGGPLGFQATKGLESVICQ
jgi:thermitase